MRVCERDRAQQTGRRVERAKAVAVDGARMNVLFGENFGIEPDICGTVFGMAVPTLALVAIPFLDKGKTQLTSWREALDRRTRGRAWLARAIFWLVLVVGMVRNFFAEAGLNRPGFRRED